MAKRDINQIDDKIDNIIRSISIFLNSRLNEEDESKIPDISILRKFTDSFLPYLRTELHKEQELLSEEHVFEIINDGLGSIAGQIRSVVHSTGSLIEQYSKILQIAQNGHNVLRDLHIIKALNVNFENKISKIDKRLINDDKNRYESEVKALRVALKTRIDDNQKAFEDLFEFYKNELQEIKNKQSEEKRIKDKAFEEFMSEIVSVRDGSIEKFDNYFNKIQRDWKRIQQIKTDSLYLAAYHKNTSRSKNSERKFIGVTVLSLVLSVLTIIAFIFKAIDFSQFISIKIMIVVFFGILIAYYLKISTHYRRLADQAEQTYLELQAFPQYAAELGEEKSNEIKGQLALKYFGKEIDPSGYQKIGEIAQEQLKTSSELVKAAASITQGAGVKNQNTNTNPPAANGGGN